MQRESISESSFGLNKSSTVIEESLEESLKTENGIADRSRKRHFHTKTIDVGTKRKKTNNVEETQKRYYGVFDQGEETKTGRIGSAIRIFGRRGDKRKRSLEHDEKYEVSGISDQIRDRFNSVSKFSGFFSTSSGRRQLPDTSTSDVGDIDNVRADSEKTTRKPSIGKFIKFSMLEQETPDHDAVQRKNVKYSCVEGTRQPRTGDERNVVRLANDNTFATVLEDRRTIRRHATELFNEYMGSSAAYLSDICIPSGPEEFVQLYNELRMGLECCDENTRRQWRIVSEHNDHVHIAHICSYSNASCRCAWLKRSHVWRTRRRNRFRRRVFVADFKISDWESVLGYFTTNGHAAQTVESRSNDGGVRLRIENIQEGRNQKSGPIAMVHPCPHKGSGHSDGGSSDEDQAKSGSLGSYGGPKVKEKPSSREDIHLWPKTLDELLIAYPCCPPDAFVHIKQFYNNKYLNHYDENCKKVRVALRNWCSKLAEWSIDDFVRYYQTPGVFPYFNAYARQIDHVYFSVAESLEIANELLLHQFDNDSETIKKFILDISNICDKKIPKLNSMCVVSPPSAGKNFFFDAIASFFLNYGMFGTANKTNHFSWADGAGKRLVLWNEPNYEQYHIEKIKELLGGDTTRIHVKYKGDQPLQGPPIFLLTNATIND